MQTSGDGGERSQKYCGVVYALCVCVCFLMAKLLTCTQEGVEKNEARSHFLRVLNYNKSSSSFPKL